MYDIDGRLVTFLEFSNIMSMHASECNATMSNVSALSQRPIIPETYTSRRPRSADEVIL